MQVAELPPVHVPLKAKWVCEWWACPHCTTVRLLTFVLLPGETREDFLRKTAIVCTVCRFDAKPVDEFDPEEVTPDEQA